jgi:hypothetical protein
LPRAFGEHSARKKDWLLFPFLALCPSGTVAGRADAVAQPQSECMHIPVAKGQRSSVRACAPPRCPLPSASPGDGGGAAA